MPTYEYQCTACGYEIEEFHSILEPPLTRCPKCDTDSLARMMGTGGGVIFKGSGFYQTDYKKEGRPADKDGGSKKGEGIGTEKKREAAGTDGEGQGTGGGNKGEGARSGKSDEAAGDGRKGEGARSGKSDETAGDGNKGEGTRSGKRDETAGDSNKGEGTRSGKRDGAAGGDTPAGSSPQS